VIILSPLSSDAIGTLIQQSDENYPGQGGQELPDEDLLEIEPADFFDPEEFGIRRSPT